MHEGHNGIKHYSKFFVNYFICKNQLETHWDDTHKNIFNFKLKGVDNLNNFFCVKSFNNIIVN